MLLLTLFACGDVSNAIFAEDADFLAALPAHERDSVVFEEGIETASKAVGEASELVVLSRVVAGSANGFVGLVLEFVDEVRGLAPTARTEDTRRWGPYAWNDEAEVDAEIVRGGAGRFDWEFHCSRDGETETTLWGTHYAGDTVANGDGSFTFDASAAGWCSGDASAGEIEVDYDARDGVDIVMDVTGWTDGSEAPIDYDYAFRLVDLLGDFQYRVAWDVNENGTDELVEVRTRWIPGQGGRSDAVVSGGDLGDIVERWTQCWNGSGVTTWETDSEGWFVEDGDVDACAWDDFADIDRI